MSNTGTRFNGTLKKWDIDRGFGFLAAEQGGQDVFVHVSSFPRDGHQPIVGEPLTFEIDRDRDGRKRAVRVQRPGVARAMPKPHTRIDRHRRTARSNSRTSWSFRTGLIALLLIASLVGFVYNQFTGARERAARLSVAPPVESLVAPTTAVPESPRPPPVVSRPLTAQAPAQRASFQCDGRQHCSQMSSCAEATYFLKNCPGTQMDGDGDGVPCEQQLCNGSFGR
ncbi:cold shock domain-containing protein [Hydrogenophaga sp.]|uniref:cold shock domain-containing protein n=1 Tax=Hydrogenophaga sp. TaxID=1904254 RepID=UPI003F6F6E6B